MGRWIDAPWGVLPIGNHKVRVGIDPMVFELFVIHLHGARAGTSSVLQIEHIMKTKHLTRTALILTIAAINPLVTAQDAPAEKSELVEKATVQPGTLTTVIADSATFSTLTKALKAAELDITLGSKDEFTIFAPTDEAFGKLPAETLTKLMLPENKEKLRMLLLYHVVAGKVVSGDLADGDVKTVNGEKISVDVKDDKIEINGAKVFSPNVAATNGVMHSLGVVLVPESLDGFAGLKK